MKPTLTTGQKVIASQEHRFCGSSLPLTMKLAWNRRATLSSCLRNSSPRWPYQDRVLCWIAPGHLADVIRFHDSGGPSLPDLRAPQEMAALDAHFCARLIRRIEGLPPAWRPPGSEDDDLDA
ncbi:MAG: hypothetical protein WCJ69_11300 [Betaproteobacteria bacterium]